MRTRVGLWYNTTMSNSRYSLFIQNLVQDALVFVFLLVVLSVFRAAFIAVFADLLAPETTANDILLTMWYGLRISLKTAGACILPSFVFATLAQAAWTKYPGPKVRFVWISMVLLILSVLFQARIPYYHEFHNAFSPFIFNTFHDDVGAIVSTSISQYNAVWRTMGAFVCAAVLCVLCRVWLKKLTPLLMRPFLKVRRPWIAVVIICIFIAAFAVFVRKGGSFTYYGSIYWKNAARMKQHLLNEAILDDIQALYKASRIYKKIRYSASDLSAQDVRAAAARLLGQSEYAADDLLPFLSRTAAGTTQPPDHIFVIVAETYMMWPLLEEYTSYPMTQGMRRLLARPDAVLSSHFLPASNGTIFGLTSVLLGIAELNLQASNRPTAQQPYETALSVQLRKHGYKTRFFYGGFPSWENVGLFMQNQQFDDSFYSADFGGEGGVWGIPDREFLDGVAEKVGGEKSFNLILTSSNHPPYKVDLSREPDLPSLDAFEKMLPAQTADKSLVAARMWHFAYADKYLAEFVEKMAAKYPNSLFVITGDHADRWTLEPTPSDYKRVAVPLVIIGPQLQHKKLPANSAGAHIDVAATTLELVLPKGTPYYALGQNIFAPQKNQVPVGISAYYWITPKEMGNVNEEKTELLPGVTTPLSEQELQAVRQHTKDVQTVTAWRILKGVEL